MDQMIMNPKWSTFPNCGRDPRENFTDFDYLDRVQESLPCAIYDDNMFKKHLPDKEGPPCSICKGDVKNACGGRGRYGLLQGCDHVFCLPCIRNVAQINLSRIRKYWVTARISGPTVQCPVCKCQSLYIMSTENFIDDPEKKKRFLSEFIESGRMIPCEFLRYGFGICFCVDKLGHDGRY